MYSAWLCAKPMAAMARAVWSRYLPQVRLDAMRDILTITGPIYLSIALGYLATRYGVFDKADMRTLGKFVVNIALPALVFNAISQRKPAELLHLDYFLAYGLGSLAALGLGWVWYRRIRGAPATPSAVAAMGMSCSNSGFVGYPIVLLTFAPVAGLVLALNMVIENVFIIPLLLALAERGRGNAVGWSAVLLGALARLVRNPLLLAVFAALAFSLLDIRLPAAVGRTVELFALASTALSLFVIGGALVGLPFKGIAPQVLPIAFGKLVLHPSAVLLVALSLPVLGMPAMEPTLFQAAILMAAMPMMGIYPVLSLAYGLEARSAAALLLTTVSSFFSINLLLWMMQSGWVMPCCQRQT